MPENKSTSPPKGLRAVFNHMFTALDERGFRILFLLILPFNILSIRDLARAKANLYTKEEPYITAWDVLIIVISAVLCQLVFEVLRVLLDKPLNERMIYSKEHALETFEQKKIRMTEYFQGMIYHSVYFTVLFINLKDSPYLPRAFGGESDITAQYREYPVSIPAHLRLLYLFPIGYSGLKLIKLVFREQKRLDYWQYLLHHHITISLIVYSFLSKHHMAGLPVIILHASTDCLAYTTRSFKEIRGLHMSPFYLSYFSFFLMWVYARVYAYPTEVFWPSAKMFTRFMGEYFFLASLILFCLFALLILDLFWLLLIVKKMIVHTRIKKQKYAIN